MNLKQVRLLLLCGHLKQYLVDPIYGPCYENLDFNGEMHAELNQPARVALNGTLYVFSVHGHLHRTDGPAVIRREHYGNRLRLAWYQHGKLVKAESIPFDPNRIDLYKDHE